MNAKTPEGSMELFEEMTTTSYRWYISRAKLSKTVHVYDVDMITALVVQDETLNKKIDKLMVDE